MNKMKIKKIIIFKFNKKSLWSVITSKYNIETYYEYLILKVNEIIKIGLPSMSLLQQ